jgi:hypothetical protein
MTVTIGRRELLAALGGAAALRSRRARSSPRRYRGSITSGPGAPSGRCIPLEAPRTGPCRGRGHQVPSKHKVVTDRALKALGTDCVRALQHIACQWHK